VTKVILKCIITDDLYFSNYTVMRLITYFCSLLYVVQFNDYRTMSSLDSHQSTLAPQIRNSSVTSTNVRHISDTINK